jgi:hypothetical protein
MFFFFLPDFPPLYEISLNFNTIVVRHYVILCDHMRIWLPSLASVRDR